MKNWQVASREWRVAVMIGLAVAVLGLIGVSPILAQEAVPAPARDVVPTITAAPAMEGTTVTIVLGALLALSEALSLIPAVKANGVLQLVVAVLRRLLGRPAMPVVLVAALAGGLSGCAALERVQALGPEIVQSGQSLYEQAVGFVHRVAGLFSADPPPIERPSDGPSVAK